MAQQTNSNLKTTMMVNLYLNPEPMDLQEYSYTFSQNGETIIVINSKGFIYKGELIEDAGQVYSLFKSYLEQSLVK